MQAATSGGRCRAVAGMLCATLVLVGVACTPRGADGTPSPAPTATPAVVTSPPSGTATGVSGNASTTDPFAYCARVGTIDAPDSRYMGEPVPRSIAEGIRRATGASANAPRCVRTRHVLAVHGGQGLRLHRGCEPPLRRKGKHEPRPSAAMTEYCAANAEADSIPAFVTGRATVFAWHCVSGTPAIARQVVEADARGFIANVWHELAPS
ncbi:MAG: hypothetical protein U0360_10650 [Dehalococcoidia bacterium]